ncbi:hypothetical protein N0B31_04705 [Salinirubellus salinus]|uniref:DUF456 domain-containing protein n=1 Tax=Salinirubellus salinus TaxID=1364945 RepID=A0A9E7R587_9EURY|nr:hypothetical protein [Salinirubellus salinus]UWM55588.1 hypothetical protein N0B31_04705 [Salinirubellus salinus]
MSDTDELLREVERQTDSDIRSDDGGSERHAGSDASAASTQQESEAATTSGGIRSRLPDRPSVPTLLTPRGLLLSVVLTVVGFLLGGFVPLVGGVTGLLGIGVAGFVLGLVGKGRYLELALSGAATGAVAFFLDRLVLSVVADFALPLTLVGGTAGLVAAVLGLYFGRDLRDGLTRSV